MQLDLWDTAGQEDYNKLRPLSYEEADVFVICFSTVERSSFDNVKDRWFPEVSSKLPEKNGMICALIVGTKIDLREGNGPDKTKTKVKDPVKIEEGEALAKELGVTYMECSALTQTGLKEVFTKIVDIYLKPKKAPSEEKASPRAGSFSNLAGALKLKDDVKISCQCTLM
eukprot:CAMPEP_0204824240 /NCGR_PEP_ID=MMETSP1346-20131115/2269_1 /ASSEMBLY_ACC=CAM_ASM_000771 /TAXON_ID=215587 /ORGANISM="Aplanochytrium stocchinoi, Strain GSBS06" /LENGTH=169 /DNA_ID=CAMNT_0051951277 /DNA_START=383 /DNA_END=892 /DNA_ORIENTATION=-